MDRIESLVISCTEMVDIEKTTFHHTNITAEMLMDQVGAKIATWIIDHFSTQNPTVLFCVGKGNNAGDALVVADKLLKAKADQQWNCGPLYLWLPIVETTQNDESLLGELPLKKLHTLEDKIQRLNHDEVLELSKSFTTKKLLIIDGLLGIGAKGSLRDPIKSAAQSINQLRRNVSAYVISIDVPSGLDLDASMVDPDTIIADHTLTIGFVKEGLLHDSATNHVGKLTIIPIPEFEVPASKVLSNIPNRSHYTLVDEVSNLLPSREFDSYKGQYGRIGILAGSIGTTGAAVLCSSAAARAGAGLITLLVSEDVYPILATACLPEVMVKPIKKLHDVLKMNFDVLAIGPGLGQSNSDPATKRALIDIFNFWEKPMVIDADGLNILSSIKGLSPLIDPPGPRLLTPHPGEMERLLKAAFPEKDFSKVSRKHIVLEFINRFQKVTLLLKGARTLVGEYHFPLVYNSTGNPGMATGGMGDTLTGICAALIGQKLSTYEAAYFGAWLHGRTADVVIECGKQSEQSLLPTDIINGLANSAM